MGEGTGIGGFYPPIVYQARCGGTMQEVLGLALATIQSLGWMPYLTAGMVIGLVGAFVAVIFRKSS